MKFICKLRAVALLGALVVVSALPVAAFAAEGVAVKNAWARPTAPGQKTAGAYMELESAVAAVVVAVESAAAAKAELHMMSMDGGVMHMRPVQKLDLPAKKTVKLAPGGLHVMLTDIKRPLKAGDKLPLTLTIEGAGGARSTVKVDAEVRGADSGKANQHH